MAQMAAGISRPSTPKAQTLAQQQSKNKDVARPDLLRSYDEPSSPANRISQEFEV